MKKKRKYPCRIERHGMSRTRIYKIWVNIRQRCENPEHPGYRYYGGRWTSICDEWKKSFTAFYLDVGDPPTPEHSIGRIDINGHYEPLNVKWCTPEELSINRRKRNSKEYRTTHPYTKEDNYQHTTYRQQGSPVSL